MSRDNDFNIFEYIITEKQSGKSYSDIRLELKNMGLDDFQVDDAIRLADEELLEKLANKGNKSFEINPKTYAYGLIIFGVLVTIITYLSAAQFGGMYIIMYGPIIGGLAIMANNRAPKRKKVFRSAFSKWKER